MATKLKGKRGATLKKGWTRYIGKDVSKPITAVARSFPTVITALAHGLPEADIPVSLLAMGELTTKNSDGEQSFSPLDRILASRLTPDTFSVNLDSTAFKAYTGSAGRLVYTPPQDLTGWLARAHFRADIDAPDPPLLALTEISGIALGGIEGTVDLTLTDEQTTALEEDLTYWNLELESPTGEVDRFEEGTLELTPDVTRT